jgi:hypothetical protein
MIFIFFFALLIHAFDHGIHRATNTNDKNNNDNNNNNNNKPESTATTTAATATTNTETATLRKFDLRDERVEEDFDVRRRVAGAVQLASTVILEHRFDNTQFAPFARVVNAPSSNNNVASSGAARVGGGVLLEPLDTGVFTLGQIKQAAGSESTRYFIRARLQNDGDAATTSGGATPLMTSMRACAYWADPSAAVLTLHVTDDGTVFHIDVRFNERVETLCTRVPTGKSISNAPKISVNFGRVEESAKVLEYQRMLRDKKKLEEEADSRPFFIKYWYYFLPLLVIFMMASAGGGQ